ncbi:2OG-Fe(II) oxygenase [Aspergillus homomorphus CBS 101889]|uniref:Fe2OG dioxygenase domain-containing protein n=1 Tax=Aspergillus homomorphus (strain CBS 101889) TaxID=1450537 RepID=A0A395I9E7_ASPHC|nr:hypothetical protein BO97DRAFT_441275 [Aspergillus homomorphus CBS 101889]RAL14764.1 hypothetical protein BO97DRAFT_441275 [Aspergillus homomorphus CBS 101889]
MDDESSDAQDSPSPQTLHKDIPDFTRTLTDLEGEVSAQMIRRCKLDACVGWFSESLDALKPADMEREKSANWLRGWPDVKSLPSEIAQKVEGLKAELQQTLARLLPDEFDTETDVSVNQSFMARLEEIRPTDSWWRQQDHRHTPDRHIKSLLNSLIDSEEVRLPGTGNDQKTEEANARAMYFTEACKQLQSAIEGENQSASFACGGIISVNKDLVGEMLESDPKTTGPVQVYWSTQKDSTARRLFLPLEEATPQSSSATLRDLVADCQPASFGRGGEDILDPSYRLAGKMEPSNFVSSFHPADFGITQLIEQVLMPGISDKCDHALHFRKLHAELYKLNIYSGPSGHFAAHVDTPRSKSQIGSLVVCLPSEFSGGKLTVRHGGQQTAFDWSGSSRSAIQWAAFYSDCEHEIEKVTEGHRLTLTYNLYITETPGADPDTASPVLQPQAFPLYKAMQEILSNPRFMVQGGVLGMFCSHAYAHASDDADARLPRALKGADLVVYSVLKLLGAQVNVLPILRRDGTADDYETYLEEHVLLSYFKGDKLQYLRCQEFLGAEYASQDEIDRRWKTLLLIRRVPAMEYASEIIRSRGGSVDSAGFYMKHGARVAPQLRAYTTTDYGYDQSLDQTAMCAWPFLYIPGITWLNNPKHSEMAFSHVVYGNEAGVGTQYSCAAIIAVIPPFSQRSQTTQ